ncbi:MAG TPA: T9SS type A sorting domain-containing protein, partial [Paludibacter sp.]|nr:T9SS type A sorting domain-containing protein [Paludibacter sp.]
SHSVHCIPGSNDLKITVNPFNTGRSCQVNIFTANGNLRFAHKFYDSTTIHLNNYVAGIYLVQVISVDETSLTKIMIH